MKANTQIHAALRNIGDSQDGGQFFEGSLKETIFWLAAKMGETTMASRIVIGIGRTKDDAALGINVARAGKQRLNDEMQQMLNELFAEGANADRDDDSPSREAATAASEADPLDDWRA